MSKKLFVGNLSFQTMESDITAAFETFGSIESVSIIADRDTGRSKGFGFVVMSEEESADKAIAQMNGSQLNGRALTVNEANRWSSENSVPVAIEAEAAATEAAGIVTNLVKTA